MARNYKKENAYRKKNQAVNTQRKRDQRAALKKLGRKTNPAGMEFDHKTKGGKKFNGKNATGGKFVSKTANRKKQPKRKG